MLLLYEKESCILSSSSSGTHCKPLRWRHRRISVHKTFFWCYFTYFLLARLHIFAKHAILKERATCYWRQFRKSSRMSYLQGVWFVKAHSFKYLVIILLGILEINEERNFKPIRFKFRQVQFVPSSYLFCGTWVWPPLVELCFMKFDDLN